LAGVVKHRLYHSRHDTYTLQSMNFDTYKIQAPVLREYVQYILFNHSDDNATNKLITSFSNNNICLGIIKDNILIEELSEEKSFRTKPGIHSYISGLYLHPHRFHISGKIDEICIDFTPLGYHKFFSHPLKTYILGENILHENWGADAVFFFEKVFGSTDFQERGALIEIFLIKKLQDRDDPFLRECLYEIHNFKGKITLTKLTGKLKCSEKKISRSFSARLDITPKDYIRILRFRKALRLMKATKLSFTDLAYELDYFDQSHFIKDTKLFTGLSPGKLHNSLYCIKADVLVSIE
jgi:AraC-like DNA-binding protein